ncbi:CDP-alcohol phosphatidyltransferase family protein [Kalamiella sp. sgz302252]|uniref:CDP-alcohol phosphatidyltransferase family protein n=1 Tax=Pantoea sp. sgz302252 TaxID=3341827 RepID=UPI0036D36A65
MRVTIKERRPIAARDKRWAQASARWLKNRGVTPDQISFASIFCALFAAAAFLFAFTFSSVWIRGSLLLLAAIMIQGRLLCNLLDGMVAVEGGLASPAGPVCNELPDRISDSLIFVAVGYGMPLMPQAAALGWCAALLALMTAYLRLLGGTCGLKQPFFGPMAKQHRMALLFGGALLAALLPAESGQWLLWLCLCIVNIGTLVTCWRRGQYLFISLRQQAEKQGEEDAK